MKLPKFDGRKKQSGYEIIVPEDMRDMFRDALSGDPDASREFADYLIYWNPNGKPSHAEADLARRLYRAAIKSGDTTAMLNYAGMYQDGVFGRKKPIAAHFRFIMAVVAYKIDPLKDRSGYRALGCSWKYDYDEIGHPTATKNRIRLLCALFWFWLGAREDEMNSLYELGDYYRNGILVRKNMEKAFSLYQEAMEAIESGPCPNQDDNMDDVALRLAQCFHHGWGTKKDLEEALRYAELAERKFRESVDKGGKWDDRFLAEAEVETIRIQRELEHRRE